MESFMNANFADIFAPQIRAEKEGIPSWLGAIREAEELEARAKALRADAATMRCKGLIDETQARCEMNVGHRHDCRGVKQ